MNIKHFKNTGIHSVFLSALLSLLSLNAQSAIDGISAANFNLTAKVDYISTADGGSLLLWGYADNNYIAGFGTRAQYPGPTLIVNQGDTVTVTLQNDLSVAAGTIPNVSIVFPGHVITATCTNGGADTLCVDGLLTMEAGTDGDEVTYTFTATHAGTYMYHSGTNPGLQVEMGLTGAIIVRPPGFDPAAPKSYVHPGTSYDYEQLFFLTEMDPRIHEAVAFDGPDTLEIQAYLNNYFPNYWFINGRTAPDNMTAAFTPWLPTQPYNSLPRMHPGDKLLMRVIGAGRDMHPFHHHGNHARVIARDGRLLESAPGFGPDLSSEVFTISSVPGKTVDAIFEWTGEGMNWDIYGTLGAGHEFAHTCNGIAVDADIPASSGFDPVTHEYCPDHGKPLPVLLPETLDLAYGGWWSGSPYLGNLGSLPPGEGGLNPNGGYSFMWHSHTEKEMANYDLFPGGMMTMMIIEAPGVPIE